MEKYPMRSTQLSLTERALESFKSRALVPLLVPVSSESSVHYSEQLVRSLTRKMSSLSNARSWRLD